MAKIKKETNPPGEIKKPHITGIALVTEGANEEEFLFIKQKNFKKEKKKMDKELAKKLIINKSLKDLDVQAILKQVDEKDVQEVKDFRMSTIAKELEKSKKEFIKTFDSLLESKTIEKHSVEEINGLIDKVIKAGDSLFFDALPILDSVTKMLMTSMAKMEEKESVEKGDVKKEKHPAFGAFISEKKKELGKTVSEMSEATGMSVEKLEDLFMGNVQSEDLTPEFMEKLAEFLEMEGSALMEIAPKPEEVKDGDPDTLSEDDLEDL